MNQIYGIMKEKLGKQKKNPTRHFPVKMFAESNTLIDSKVRLKTCNRTVLYGIVFREEQKSQKLFLEFYLDQFRILNIHSFDELFTINASMITATVDMLSPKTFPEFFRCRPMEKYKK